MSGLTFNVFTPALFLAKLSNITLSDLLALWPLSANMALTHLLGAAIGLAIARLSPGVKGFRRHLMAATTVGNVGNLPLVIAESLASGPGAALLGPSASLGLHYVMLGNLSATFIQVGGGRRG